MFGIKEIGRALRKGIDKRIKNEEIYAETGAYDESTGQFTLFETGFPKTRVWIRLHGNQNETYLAYNTAVGIKSQLPVYVVERNGEYEITRLAPKEATEALGDMATHFGVPQQYGEALNIILPGDKLLPGRVRASELGGLYVYIEPFSYMHYGVVKSWPGGHLDLSSHVPATASKIRWAKVGIDPATNTAVAASGDDFPIMVALTRDQFDAISFAYITNGGVMLRTGQTTITDFRTFIDGRLWIWQTQLVYYQIIQDDGTPVTQRPVLNIFGTGVTVTDNPVDETTDVEITGGGGSSAGEGNKLFLYENYFRGF